MPARLDRINTILDEVEQKGRLFLEALSANDAYEIEVGSVKIWYEEDGRAYFLRKPGGLPVWSDLTLITADSSRLEVGLNLSFSEYELEYTALKARQLTANARNQLLDQSDALEALVLAELVKDLAASEALIYRLSKYFPNLRPTLKTLLNRGNTRLRSAFGRIWVLFNDPEAGDTLLETLEEESADGVRADIICTAIVQGHAMPGGIPQKALERWLSSEQLIDALSCIMSLTGLGLPVAPELFAKVQPQFQAQLAPWLENKPKIIF
jgi:hypothetical protein